MSDDLIEAPERIWAGNTGTHNLWDWDEPVEGWVEYVRADMLHEIFLRYSKTETDRIEELEAKLAKAVEAIKKMQVSSDAMMVTMFVK